MLKAGIHIFCAKCIRGVDECGVECAGRYRLMYTIDVHVVSLLLSASPNSGPPVLKLVYGGQGMRRYGQPGGPGAPCAQTPSHTPT